MMVIRDPRLLPYYLSIEEAAAVTCRSPWTIRRYCQEGIWRAGVHFLAPPHGRRVYLRDGILAWLGIEESAATPTPRRLPLSRINAALSPALAAAYEREHYGC